MRNTNNTLLGWCRGLALCAGLLAAGSLPAHAGELQGIDAVMDRIAQVEKGITSLRCTYRQEVHYTLTNETTSTQGQLTFMKPSHLSIKQTRPLEQVILTDGKKVWVYTPSYKQAVTDSWKKWSKSSMVPSSVVDLIGNLASLENTWRCALQGEEENSYVLLLTPKSAGGRTITVWIDRDTCLVKKVALPGENVTVTTYASEYQVNPQVDRKFFTFAPPKGVEVISMQ